VALGQVFSEYFGFPCQFAFRRLLHNHHHLSPGAKQWPQYQVDSVSPHEKKIGTTLRLLYILGNQL
jgi:hypothetical protein